MHGSVTCSALPAPGWQCAARARTRLVPQAHLASKSLQSLTTSLALHAVTPTGAVRLGAELLNSYTSGRPPYTINPKNPKPYMSFFRVPACAGTQEPAFHFGGQGGYQYGGGYYPPPQQARQAAHPASVCRRRRLMVSLMESQFKCITDRPMLVRTML